MRLVSRQAQEKGAEGGQWGSRHGGPNYGHGQTFQQLWQHQTVLHRNGRHSSLRRLRHYNTGLVLTMERFHCRPTMWDAGDGKAVQSVSEALRI